jgi:hypothetical protein
VLAHYGPKRDAAINDRPPTLIEAAVKTSLAIANAVGGYDAQAVIDEAVSVIETPEDTIARISKRMLEQ